MTIPAHFLSHRLKCKRCINNIQSEPPPENSDCTSHLSQWYHCSNNRGLPDSNLAEAWRTSKCISFVFHHRSQGEVKATSVDVAAKREAEAIDVESNCKKSKKSRRISSEDEDYDEPKDDSKDSDFE